jgi:hypothetical protein
MNRFTIKEVNIFEIIALVMGVPVTTVWRVLGLQWKMTPYRY